MPLLVQSGGVSGGAVFTLLGVGITGFVTLASVLVKHILDARVEKQRYLRQRESEQLEHQRNLERLRIEAEERRSDALLRQQTEILARFLSATLGIYAKVQTARREWRDHQEKDSYVRDLRSIDMAGGPRWLLPGMSELLADPVWQRTVFRVASTRPAWHRR